TDFSSTFLDGDTMLTVSGDGLHAGFLNASRKDAWGLYRATDNGASQNYLNFALGSTELYVTTHWAARRALGGRSVWSLTPCNFGVIGQITSAVGWGPPLAGVYDPVRPIAYVPYTGKPYLFVVDMNTFEWASNYNIGGFPSSPQGLSP